MRIPLKVFVLWKPNPTKVIRLAKELLAFAEERLGKDSLAAAEQAVQLREAVRDAEDRNKEFTARLGKVTAASQSIKELQVSCSP